MITYTLSELEIFDSAGCIVNNEEWAPNKLWKECYLLDFIFQHNFFTNEMEKMNDNAQSYWIFARVKMSTLKIYVYM